MIRRIPGTLLVAVGALFIIWTFAANLIAVGPAFDELTDDFRPFVDAEAIDTARGDIAGLEAVSAELSTTAIPTLAGALGTTPEQLQQMMATQYPAVATGIAALPTIVPTFAGVVDTLDAQRTNFEKADAIPASNLPATTVPWSLLIVGVAVAGLGAWMLIRPTRLDAIIATVVGVGLVAAPLLLSIPDKAAAADDLNAALTPVYTPEMVAGGAQALAVVQAMGTQMQTELVPDLAAQMQLPPEQVMAFLGENLPATTAALATLPEAMGRFQTMISAFDANLDNFETLKPVAFTPIAWMMIIGGLLTVVGGGLPLLSEAFRGDPIVRHRVRPTPAM